MPEEEDKSRGELFKRNQYLMILKILSLSRWQKLLQLSNDFQACGIDINPGLEKENPRWIIQTFVKNCKKIKGSE